MNWMEEILIICGISLDVFAAMACQGALVAKIEKGRLALLCVWIVLCQLAALSCGSLISSLLKRQAGSQELVLGEILAALIFFGLGFRLLRKAWRNERIPEKRESHPNWKRFLSRAAATGFYTLLAGIAFGFLGICLPAVLGMAIALSILGAVLGMYTGYRLGFEQKRKAYAAGAILLLAAGADVVVRYILN